jgi:hypothetical protein
MELDGNYTYKNSLWQDVTGAENFRNNFGLLWNEAAGNKASYEEIIQTRIGIYSKKLKQNKRI